MAVNIDWLYGEFVKLQARVEALERASKEQETIPVYEGAAEQEEPKGEQEGQRRVHRGRAVQKPAGSGGQES